VGAELASSRVLNHFLFNLSCTRNKNEITGLHLCFSFFMLVLITLCSSSSAWSSDICRDTMELRLLCQVVMRQLMGRMSSSVTYY
jgi:hypothetical protein